MYKIDRKTELYCEVATRGLAQLEAVFARSVEP